MRSSSSGIYFLEGLFYFYLCYNRISQSKKKGNFMKKNKKEYLLILLRMLPLFFIIIFGLIYSQNKAFFTSENIFQYTPKNMYLAGLFFLFLYALKPISLVIPLVVLQVSCAMFFSPVNALIINTLGVGIAAGIAYFIGLNLGKNRVEKMLSKVKKKGSSKLLDSEGEFFYVFLVRIVGIISMDLSGMAFGSIKVKFLNYMLASILGLMPAVIIGTFIGVTLSDPMSPAFILSLLLKGFLVLLSIYLYKRKYKENNNNQ
jgi:uncharacterized membrane protein YdjX (TVP38/TMEM64 family)